MDLEKYNELMAKEKEMETKINDMKNKISKVTTDMSNATDKATRDKIQINLDNLLLSQQKLMLDYDILQNNIKALKLESAEVIDEASNISPKEQMRLKIDGLNKKRNEINNKIKTTNDKISNEKDSDKRALLRCDLDIFKNELKKIDIELSNTYYKGRKIDIKQTIDNNKASKKEDKSTGKLSLVNEDISGWGMRHIPVYRGVKTQIVSKDVYFTNLDLDELTEDDIKNLIKTNYTTFNNLSKRQKKEFYRMFNSFVVKDASKHTSKATEYTDDYEMIVVLSEFGVELHTNTIEDNDEPENDTNVDGTVGDVMYDDIKTYVPNYGEDE